MERAAVAALTACGRSVASPQIEHSMLAVGLQGARASNVRCAEPGNGVPGNGRGRGTMAGMGSRVSDVIAAIAPSATLAVDAKAKALKAAGEPVIGFGAGEPDFPTPEHIVEAAVLACRDPKNHRYTPAGGLPELKEAVAAKTARDSGYDIDAGAGADHQRRQARRRQRLRHADRPGRRGPAARAVLDHLPRADPPRGRRARRAPHRRGHRLPGHRRAAREGPHRPRPRRSCS